MVTRKLATWLALLVAMSLLAALACNAPLEPEPTLQPPSGGTAPATQTVAPGGEPATLPAGSPIPADTTTPRPTFTPIQEPTVAQTFTPEPPTATPRVANTPTKTSTPADTGPLAFTYQIVWSLDANDPSTAIATVTINATGGGGDYRYFRDEVEVEGPQFTYRWGACRGNPGSFRVTSADGQSVKKDYFSTPPCPTPTPTS